ncbi:MAG: hypothetical protein HYR56_23315 [Acidobacteria bacterium]|nr:hypothetical protein [Acidobacteriota bacterium]MBI3426120.1 hypothetical protein [Acidobacteriota bacterium]
MNAAQASALLAQINSIETQLTTLKQRVQKFAAQNDEQPHTFADLEGVWAGQNFSEEEIEAALYKLTPEWIDEIATIPSKAE